MRIEKLDNPKLKKLLQEKTDLILEGREKSQEVEELEQEMNQIDIEIQALEKTVDLSEIEAKAKDITDRMNIVMTEMQNVEKEIYEKVKVAVPQELKDKYAEKKRLKEKFENERNRIALKVQKKKDLIIPLTQRIAKSLLQDEFEDYSDVRLENGEVILEFFSHLEDWKEAHRKKLQNKVKVV